MVEVTGDVNSLPPLMLSLAVSSAVASWLCPDALDEILIHTAGLPYLHEEPPKIIEDLVRAFNHPHSPSPLPGVSPCENLIVLPRISP